MLWSINANAVHTKRKYDLLGRVTSVFEKEDYSEYKCAERFIYGEQETNAENNNLRGQVIRNYDTAGLLGVKIIH